MSKQSFSLSVFLLFLFASIAGLSQSGKGVISGVVKDKAGAVLQGAKITLQPQVRPITTDGQGEFTVTEVSPGTYSVTVSYVGFDTYNGSVTVVAASTSEKGSKGSGGNVAAAREIGKRVAERARERGITKVVFDRGGYLYHGRVKALADAAREAGLEF